MRTISFISLIFAACALIAGGCKDSERDISDETELSQARESALRFSEEVRLTGRLQLARAEVKKVGTIDDLLLSHAHTAEGKIRGILNKLKVGSRKGIYSFRTFVSASIDLTSMPNGSLEIDTISRRCRLTLREPEITIDGRDVIFTEEHHRVSGLRSDITPEERAELKAQMSTAVVKELLLDIELAERLRNTAKNKARVFFQTLAWRHGLTATVEFAD